MMIQTVPSIQKPQSKNKILFSISLLPVNVNTQGREYSTYPKQKQYIEPRLPLFNHRLGLSFLPVSYPTACPTIQPKPKHTATNVTNNNISIMPPLRLCLAASFPCSYRARCSTLLARPWTNMLYKARTCPLVNKLHKLGHH